MRCDRVLRTVLLFALSPALLPSVVSAQKNDPPQHVRDKPADAEELKGITERGRAIAAYDAAAWHATDAVQALKPKDGLVEMYIGRQTRLGWEMAFGKLSPNRDTFLLAFETKPGPNPKLPEVIPHEPALKDQGEWLRIARALDLARTTFGPAKRPYNGAVLQAPSGWFVYFYPAQTDDDVFPTGADVRYRISDDETKVEETHRMHMGLLEYKKAPAQKTLMTYHTAILDDAPEDMDVANVLMMGGMPQMIATRNFVYRIEKDGAIQCLGLAKDVLKRDKQ